jgi:integrase
VARKGNTWFIVLELGSDDHGKRRRKWVSGGWYTEEAARASLPQVLADHGLLTVEAWLLRWLELKRATLRPTTWEGYGRLLRKHVLPRIGELPVQTLSPDHIDELYRNLLAARLAARTVRQVHAILRKAGNDAVRKGMLERNPALAADPPRVEEAMVRVWTPAQVAHFLSATAHDEFSALWVLAATTGLRRGELLGLRWEDIDLERAALFVRRTKVWTGRELVESQPKTRHGRRVVALDPRTVAVLRRYQLRSRVFPMDRGVFPDLDPSWVSKRFTVLAERAGLPHIRFHDLRHTHATLGLLAGVDAKVISMRLGHHSAGFTADYYQHLLAGMQEQAATRMASLVFGE